ncbi:hypothetical protein [Burkholderia sp. S171]|uniref:hypothetical protein n=1 Tax=Burkholderia sp. S171 TaxID=1641860 RepID=UPI00131DBAE5|nr:hypothetical protein [Burkholderia sp. S171]
MRDLERIKAQANTCVIFTDAHPQGVRGVIHMARTQAIYCHPVDGGHVWTINGEHVRESTVRSLISGG